MNTPKPKYYLPTKKQKQAADPAHSVWVSANAGSGKTEVLVQRVIRLLLDGVLPDSILSITYTKAAAAEMANRLFAQLARWTSLDDEELSQTISDLGADGENPEIITRARQLFTRALETPGGLKIQTIHAFCERLLHLFPVEAGLSPGFQLLDDRAADELRDNAISDVVYNANPGSEISAAFERLSVRLNQEQFTTMITDFTTILRQSEPGILSLSPSDFSVLLKTEVGLSGTDFLTDAQAELSTVDQNRYAQCAAAMKGSKLFNKVDISGQLLAIAQARDATQLLTDFYLTKKHQPRSDLLSVKMINDHPEVDEFIQREALRLKLLLYRVNALQLVEANTDAFTVASSVLRYIEVEKQKSGKVDFDDLIRRTAQLLSQTWAHDWVTFKLDAGLTHILLDESQDTGRAQWIIIDRLVKEFFAGKGQDFKAIKPDAPRTLFVVGDEKQSIFSFLGADVATYDVARQNYVNSGQLQNVTLDISYRSSDTILRAVDIVHTDQSGSDKLLRAHTASRIAAAGIVVIWPLVKSDDKPENAPWQKPIDRPPQSSPKRILARQIATRIKSWIDPQRPRKLAGREEAVSAGDIMILFRTRNQFFPMVMAELRAVGIPVAGADRLQLLQSLIVKDLLALLNWLLLPQDDHALACILKSPLLPEPLTEAELFAAAYDRKDANLVGRLSHSNQQWLDELRSAAMQVSPDRLLARILTKCRKAISARLGPEALEASDAVLDMAITYQIEGNTSLFGFVQWFQATETTLKREMEKAGSEVRLMTVHGAKGLQAPIVIIADAAKSPYGGTTKPQVLGFNSKRGVILPLWLDSNIKPLPPDFEALKGQGKMRQRDESERLLYVAMTRAEDELYIAGVGQGKKNLPAADSWWLKIAQTLMVPLGDQPLRFGAEEIFLNPMQKPGSFLTPSPPPWLDEAPPPQAAIKQHSHPAALSQNKTYDAVAAKHGRARHRLLQDLAEVSASERRALALSRAARLKLSEKEAVHLADALSEPELTPYLGADSRAEVDIQGTLTDGSAVVGRVDRLAVRSEGIWLLDYKTGQETVDAHLPQMAGYVALLRAVFPDRPVQAALFFTQSGTLHEFNMHRLTAALHRSDGVVT